MLGNNVISFNCSHNLSTFHFFLRNPSNNSHHNPDVLILCILGLCFSFGLCSFIVAWKLCYNMFTGDDSVRKGTECEDLHHAFMLYTQCSWQCYKTMYKKTCLLHVSQLLVNLDDYSLSPHTKFLWWSLLQF